MSGFENWERVTMRETSRQSDDSGLPPVNALTPNSPATLATNDFHAELSRSQGLCMSPIGHVHALPLGRVRVYVPKRRVGLSQ
jgi:hypothetical protein